MDSGNLPPTATMDEVAAAIQAEEPMPMSTANADLEPNSVFEPVVQALEQQNHQPTVVMAPLKYAPRDEVVITDNDVL